MFEVSEVATAPTVTHDDRSFIAVRDAFNGDVIGSVCATLPDSVDDLLAAARSGRSTARSMSRAARAAVLDGAARIVEERRESFARTIVAEAGKTLLQARREVARAVNTLALSAAEARRNVGEVVPFDAYQGSETRKGWFTREPLGIIVAITPYNDPLNLVAHKLGPAIAGGNAVILKPSELAPLSALRLADCLLEAGLPENVVTVVNGGSELGEALVSATDVRMVSFTGGFSTGKAIARSAGLKKLAMDLGGNGAVIVFADADLDDAVASCVSGAFWAAGQNCIGTQRILIARELYPEFRTAFVDQARRLRVGDPSGESTDVGPMITAEHARNTKDRVDAAVAEGATVLCGNRLDGSVYHPTALEDVPPTSALWREEAFSPIAILQPFDTDEEAIDAANGVEIGLHAGIFTASLARAMHASASIDAGGIMINDSSDYRLDAMPFGGFKFGSMGREGVQFAYEEMTQPKVVCINGPA